MFFTIHRRSWKFPHIQWVSMGRAHLCWACYTRNLIIFNGLTNNDGEKEELLQRISQKKSSPEHTPPHDRTVKKCSSYHIVLCVRCSAAFIDFRLFGDFEAIKAEDIRVKSRVKEISNLFSHFFSYFFPSVLLAFLPPIPPSRPT